MHEHWKNIAYLHVHLTYSFNIETKILFNFNLNNNKMKIYFPWFAMLGWFKQETKVVKIYEYIIFGVVISPLGFEN
jgi:hypothetical protein